MFYLGLIGTGQDTANDEELLALERELDVNRLLKVIADYYLAKTLAYRRPLGSWS